MTVSWRGMTVAERELFNADSETGVEIIALAPARRDAWTDVHRWVLNSWIRGLLDAGIPGFAYGVDAKTYLDNQHDLIARLLGVCELHLAVEPTAHDLYRGWALGSEGCVHYVCTKKLFRGQGIARALVQSVAGDGPVSYTHRLARYRGELQTKMDNAGMVYNPYLLFGAVVGAGKSET
jgi:GNAT superfamily N-acetyltransferase